MAKNNRGKRLKTYTSICRGECPKCHRTGIKLLYNFKIDSNTTSQVCKFCRER